MDMGWDDSGGLCCRAETVMDEERSQGEGGEQWEDVESNEEEVGGVLHTKDVCGLKYTLRPHEKRGTYRVPRIPRSSTPLLL